MSAYYLNKDTLLSSFLICFISWFTALVFLTVQQFSGHDFDVWNLAQNAYLPHTPQDLFMAKKSFSLFCCCWTIPLSLSVCKRHTWVWGSEWESAGECHSQLWLCRCLNCGDVIGHKGNRNKSFTVLDLIPWLLISQSASNRNNCHM